MILYSMTATFGKLERQTLTLKPGLNIIEAPNEWGKSTWCAFLCAMLYGIDTRSRSVTKTALADKTRYDPWSGSLMSGRIDLNWEGRDITIERGSTKRAVMKEFRAYETATGIAIPELTGENCGQLLLGVERSVFTRSVFIRGTDMPVTEDEALRRRLNDLVTTGDESGAADTLSRRLQELKNACRANRSKGLLPQAEEQRRGLQATLAQLRQLEERHSALSRRSAQLEQRHTQLLNHRDALAFQHSARDEQRLAQAVQGLEQAQARLASLEEQCRELPDEETARRQLQTLTALHREALALQMETQMLPELTPPKCPLDLFIGLSGQEAVDLALSDGDCYRSLSRQLEKKAMPPWWLAAVPLLVCGAVLLVLRLWPCWLFLAAGIGVILAYTNKAIPFSRKQKQTRTLMRNLETAYGSPDPLQWAALARGYEQERAEYLARTQRESAARKEQEQRRQALAQQIRSYAAGRPLGEAIDYWEHTAALWDARADALRELQRCAALEQALRSSLREVRAPRFSDPLTYTREETDRLTADCAHELRQLQHQLGQCQGQMEALGAPQALEQQLAQTESRIRELEDTYAALELAQQTLSQATAQLQRRFAPRLSRQAQDLFARLTGGRYDRLALGEDLSLHTGARDENVLRSPLWRSEGTADQLYLALRLAVARELIPAAPLILDDALARFDDTRLGAAMAVLQEEAQTRQVIVFTCQDRENAALL